MCYVRMESTYSCENRDLNVTFVLCPKYFSCTFIYGCINEYFYTFLAVFHFTYAFPRDIKLINNSVLIMRYSRK